ncbi:3'-5' exonuclease [Streptomyces sp. NPDC001795]|uniref:3'-5' exonuclease n=1 Tax=Streptomyces sp. NPDC001795 TaxID=3154525 RepID=UPI0033208F89
MNFSGWPALLVVDTEGNGTQPPDLVEVAALPFRSGEVDTLASQAWLICPPRPVTLRATSVHGLTNEVLAAEPAWDEVGDRIGKFLGNLWICAHNAHVDYRVLKAHLPDWEPLGVIDTLRLARATVKNLPAYTLDFLIKHLGLDLAGAPAGGRHRAAFDAYAAAQLLVVLARQYDTFEDVVAAAVPPGLPGAPEPEPDLTLW